MLTVRSGPFAALSAEAARSLISGSAPKRTSIRDIAAIAKAKTRVMHCSKVTSLFDHLVGAGERCRQNRSSSGLNAKEAPPAGELTQQGVIIDAADRNYDGERAADRVGARSVSRRLGFDQAIGYDRRLWMQVGGR
jgi:hypothetical protein